MSAPDSAPQGDPRRWAILAIMSFAVFMAVMDISIVNISLPTIVADLHTTFAAGTWVLNAYNVAFAVLLVTAGRLADLQGRRRWLLAGIAVFGIASLACALAPSIGALIAFRVIQAAGAAIMVPVALAIVTLAFPPHERGTAIGAWGAAAAGAAALGPPLGGTLTELASWHWIFGVNVPVCALAFVLAARLVPESRDPTATGAIDWGGIAALSAALLSLNLALVQGDAWGWGSARVVGLLVASVAGLLAFVAVERRTREPIVDFDLFRVPAFARCSTAVFLLGLGVLGGSYALALLLQEGWGEAPLRASATILPMSVAAFIVGPWAGRLSDRLGVRIIAAPGLALFGTSVLLMATLGDHRDTARAVVLATLAGIGIGASFPVLVGGAMATVRGPKAGMASGLVNVVRQIGFVLGIALVEATLGSGPVSSLGGSAFAAGFIICGAAGLLGAAVALSIPRLGETRAGAPGALRPSG